MKTFGEEIKFLRNRAKLPLRVVSAYLDMDQAILSKIENGKRNASKEQVIKLANYFNVDEKKLMVNYLADKIVEELKYEDSPNEILQVAEGKIAYGNIMTLNQNSIINSLKNFFINESRIAAAYLFGSTARNEATENSDIDVMIEFTKTKKHTMFDLFDIKHQLENLFNRKVDVVEKGFIKPHAQKTISKDLKLIIKK